MKKPGQERRELIQSKSADGFLGGKKSQGSRMVKEGIQSSEIPGWSYQQRTLLEGDVFGSLDWKM